ncbi:hypothetical protein DH26_gp066 [Chloriridovirus anopheles1]|uniref:Uncharacterized protein n=1 Tax=Chloriridovirus anopheles1 TaxID=1465751 RepID=W8QF22_9VIRU|nr:hypothetical protein DH26_gp066 [Anopheles minimus iridovirus]AHL67559.1 hypothetical protein AMIV_066 [Anopheles minimus iridovirus]
MNINHFYYYTPSQTSSPTPDAWIGQRPLSDPIDIPRPKPHRFWCTSQPLLNSPKFSQILETNKFKLDETLPKHKIEGVLNMVNFEIKNILEEPIDFEANLWLHSFGNSSSVLKGLDRVYVLLLKELMLESIKTPADLYKFLFDNAISKKMTFLVKLLELAAEKNFEQNGDIAPLLNMDDKLETFILALQTFIQFEDKPCLALEKARATQNENYKLFLLTFVGASYGCNWINPEHRLTPEKINNFLTLLNQ